MSKDALGLLKNGDRRIPTRPITELTAQPMEMSRLQLDPERPRRSNDARVGSLAESIKTHGQLQPIVVTKNNDSGLFTVVVGKRRYLACQLLGREQIYAS